jgi:hypothetical protein
MAGGGAIIGYRMGCPRAGGVTEGVGLFHEWTSMVSQPEEYGGDCRGGVIGEDGLSTSAAVGD